METLSIVLASLPIIIACAFALMSLAMLDARVTWNIEAREATAQCDRLDRIASKRAARSARITSIVVAASLSTIKARNVSRSASMMRAPSMRACA